MHELAIAEDLLKVIDETIKDTNMKKVTKIRVGLSDPPMVETESLEFCFKVLSEQTPCANASIVFEKGTNRGIYLMGIEGED